MTPEQAKRFYRDGYLIVRGAVPKKQAMAARRLMFARIGELRAAARDVDWVRRDFEHKLARAQEQAMVARAEAEAARAELEAFQRGLAETLTEESGTVVYERVSDVAEYETAIAAMDADNYLDAIEQAI